MNINGISGRGGNFALEIEGGVMSMAGQLALLTLESEETRKQIEREGLASAREGYVAAVEDEVQALRDQADAARLGALVTGSIGIASAGLDVWATIQCESSSWQQAAGGGLARLASPLGTYVSETYGAADAAAARGEREQAGWELEDRKKALATSDERQDKALEWVGGLLSQDAATTAAILSNHR